MQRKGTEYLVGLFILIGLLTIGGLVVTFGRVGQGLKETYDLTVQFPNASGLVNNADVLMAGARIGHVAGAPRLVIVEGKDGVKNIGVDVSLKIVGGTQIPKQCAIVVSQSGLLGDVFVDIIPEANANIAEAIAPGSHIMGTRNTGLDDLTKKGAVVMDLLAEELVEIKTMTSNLNGKLLNPTNLQNLETTFAKLKETSENFANASKNLDGLFTKLDTSLNKLGTGVETGAKALDTMEKAATDLRGAVGDIRKMADTGTKALDSAAKGMDSFRVVMGKVERGEGLVGTLLNDKRTADDFRSFIANARTRGLLFYKDKPVQEPPAPGPRAPSPNQRTR